MVYNVIKHTGEVKMAKEDSIHSGHRRRLKESMLKSDFKGISDINLLEAILFYSVSRSDTNETAHKLLESFGSVEKVFEAHFEDLKNVPGIGDNSAFLIKLINETAKKIVLHPHFCLLIVFHTHYILSPLLRILFSPQHASPNLHSLKLRLLIDITGN